MDSDLSAVYLPNPNLAITEAVDPSVLRRRSLSISSPLTAPLSRSRSRSGSRDFSDALCLAPSSSSSSGKFSQLLPQQGFKLRDPRGMREGDTQHHPRDHCLLSGMRDDAVQTDSLTHTDIVAVEETISLSPALTTTNTSLNSRNTNINPSNSDNNNNDDNNAERLAERGSESSESPAAPLLSQDSERDGESLCTQSNAWLARFLQRSALTVYHLNCRGKSPIFETYFDGSKVSLAHVLNIALRNRRRIHRYRFTQALPFLLHNLLQALPEEELQHVAEVDIAHYGTTILRVLNRSTAVDIEDSVLCIDLADVIEALKQESWASAACSSSLLSKAIETAIVGLSAPRVRHWLIVGVMGLVGSLIVRRLSWWRECSLLSRGR